MATTTTNYGFDIPTSTDYVKDGATAIATLGQDIDTNLATVNLAGLVLVKTQTIGSAVSSVTVTNAFSATYENYRIVISNSVASASNALRLSYNNSTGSTYSHVGTYYTWGSTTTVNEAGSSLTYTWIGNVQGGNTNVVADIFNPFVSSSTYSIGHGVGPTNPVIRYGQDTANVSNTGFTITPGAGTLTGGTIYVYGYRKAI